MKDVLDVVIKALEVTNRNGSISIFTDKQWLITDIEEKAYEKWVRDGFHFPNGESINNEVEWRKIHALATDRQIYPIYLASEKLRMAVFGEQIEKSKKCVYGSKKSKKK